MPDKEITRADDLVAQGLALPDQEGREYFSTVVTNLVGMTAETEQARAAQEQKNERLRDELDYVSAQNDHMMRVLRENGIDVESTGFHYDPPVRRRRQSIVRKPIDILMDLIGLRPEHDGKPEIVEATATGSITSLPRVEVVEEVEEPIELQVVGNQPTLAEYLETTRLAEPQVLTDIDEDASPSYHRSTPVVEDTVLEPHPTRGIDIPPPAYTHIPSDLDISTGKITLPATPVSFDALLTPQPKTAASVVISEEEPSFVAQPEDRRSRRERVRAERAERRARRKARS